MDKAILIGARGWDNDDWAGGFYPDDLPEDWRLGYYSNRLRAVLVPADVWQGMPDTEEWAGDIDPGFRMVLEWALATEATDARVVCDAVRRLIQDIDAIADNVDAWLLTVTGEGVVDDGVLVSVIECLSGWRPVCLSAAAGQVSKGVLTSLEGRGVALCWHPGEDEPADGGRFLVALTEAGSGREQRSVIERVGAWAEQPGRERVGAAVFFTGPGAADHAAQARIIAEMMGV